MPWVVCGPGSSNVSNLWVSKPGASRSNTEWTVSLRRAFRWTDVADAVAWVMALDEEDVRIEEVESCSEI